MGAGLYYESMTYFVNVQGQTLTGLVVNQADVLSIPPNAQVCIYPVSTLAAPMACTVTAVDY